MDDLTINMDNFQAFSSGCTNNLEYSHLWIEGAAQFIPQLNGLLKYAGDQLPIYSIDTFDTGNYDLGYIFAHNKSDKSTAHNYHLAYTYILDKLGKDSPLNILEIGLGTNNPALASTMGIGARPGASLYAFREYLPHAKMYGCDIDKDILFEDERIKTCYVDQMDRKSFDALAEHFGPIRYDLIIDDGLHSICTHLNTLLYALEVVNDNGWIVIEDIHIRSNWRSIDSILRSCNRVKTYYVAAQGGDLYLVHKLPTSKAS